MKKFYPLLSILLVNAIPIIGVFVLGWNVFQLICIFWIESLLIGVFNIAKMAIAQKPSKGSTMMKVASKVGLMMFFCLHYFFFLLIVGAFVFSMVIDKHQLDFTRYDYKLIILMLIGGCTASFITDYILPKKYLSASPSELLVAPYGRVLVLIALIFAGGFVSHAGMGNNYFYLAVLVIVKLLGDGVSWLLFNRANIGTHRVE
jgi:Family of unknown function (DUF6498)